MARKRARKTTSAVKYFFGLKMALLLFFQGVLLICILSYGYIPIPEKWANGFLGKQSFYGLRMKASEVHFYFKGEVKVSGVQLFDEDNKHTLIDADLAIIRLGIEKEDSFKLAAKSLIITNGALYLPPDYYLEGVKAPVITRAGFRLKSQKDRLVIDHFAAKHGRIQVSGTIEWPLKPASDDYEGERIEINNIYSIIGDMLRKKDRFSPFPEPSLNFRVNILDQERVGIHTSIFSQTIDHPQVSGSNIRLESSFILEDKQLYSTAPLEAYADSITLENLKIEARRLTAKVSGATLKEILSGSLPTFLLASEALLINEVPLEAPMLEVNSEKFPEISFTGTTKGLKGAVAVNGTLNVKDKSGTLDAAGSIDLLSLLPESKKESVPALAFNQPPYCQLKLKLAPGLEITEADFTTQVEEMSANDIAFDFVDVAGHYRSGTFSLDRVSLERGEQQVDFGFLLDLISKDYLLTIEGWAIPYEYNSILPRWWEAIFRKIRFSEKSSGRGEFVIHGNTGKKVAKSFFGFASVTNASYSDIPVDRARVFLRSKGRYVEIHKLDAVQDAAWAKGKIAFTSFSGRPGPAVVRFDLESYLPLNAAKQIFGSEVGKVIDEFEISQLPHVTLKGTRFHRMYPEFNGLSSFNLLVDTRGPVTFKNLPFDTLAFAVTGDQSTTYLRDIYFGYAGGDGEAVLDINRNKNASPTVTMKMQLKAADRELALQNLPAASLGGQATADTAQNDVLPNSQSKLDLNLHVSGPANDPFAYMGFGDIVLKDSNLGTIQLLGPLSKLLQQTPLNFTSFTLEKMEANFEVIRDELDFKEMKINGPTTQIKSTGIFGLRDRSLDMRVGVYLFRNLGEENNPLRKLTDIITTPIPFPNLLDFQLTGTVDDQSWRSQYDPRNLMQIF